MCAMITLFKNLDSFEEKEIYCIHSRYLRLHIMQALSKKNRPSPKLSTYIMHYDSNILIYGRSLYDIVAYIMVL